MKVILQCTVGSRLYGVATQDSDHDQAGIFLEDPKNIFGLSSHEHEISNDGLNDLSLFSLKKWARLVINGNPSTTSLLWIKKEQASIWTPEFEEIQNNKHLFLSQRTIDAYLGYMQGQRHRLKGEKGGRRKPARQELIEKFGYDTKYAMHLLRLGKECIDLIFQKKIEYPFGNIECSQLQEIREGKFSLDTVLFLSESMELAIKDIRQGCWLPEKPNMELIDNLLIKLYRNYDRSNS